MHMCKNQGPSNSTQSILPFSPLRIEKKLMFLQTVPFSENSGVKGITKSMAEHPNESGLQLHACWALRFTLLNMYTLFFGTMYTNQKHIRTAERKWTQISTTGLLGAQVCIVTCLIYTPLFWNYVHKRECVHKSKYVLKSKYFRPAGRSGV